MLSLGKLVNTVVEIGASQRRLFRFVFLSHPHCFMGRPNSKRLRSQHADTPPLINACNQQRGSLSSTWMCLEKRSSLNSLVMTGTIELSDHVCAIDGVSVPRLRVQQVWGALSEADIAPPPGSGLRLGINAQVDSAGVAWLNAARSPESEISSSPLCGHESGDSSTFSLCGVDLRAKLSKLKEAFDDISAPVFKRVRSECNPAEALGSGPFLNRSAMKLANIDAIVGLSAPPRASAAKGEVSDRHSPSQHREPRDKNTEGEARRTESPEGKATPLLFPLLFADLCGGPGGFSEYLIRKRGQLGLSARGWGISLRDSGCSSGQGSNIEGGRGERKNSSQIRNQDGGLTSAHRGGDQGVTRFDGIRCDAALGALSQPPESSKDPCAWRLDRLALRCHVSTKRERKHASVEETGAEGSSPKRASADVGEANVKYFSGGVNGMGVSGTASYSVESLDDRDYRSLETEGGGNTAEVTTSRPCSPVTVKAPTVTEVGAKESAAPRLEMTIDYGPKGTGDLLDEANRVDFVDSVLVSTGGRRLDVVVADGGFIAARDAKDQERLILPLVHAEALTALQLLAEGGSFVCKMFEVWTKPTASLVYLLHRKFRRISIFKPITSRPASGERYLVCSGLLPQSLEGCRLTKYLNTIVGERAWERTPCPGTASSGDAFAGASDGAGALDLESDMRKDVAFLSYLRLVNDRLATVQADACGRIIEVSSTKQGRAWAFRGGKGKDEACSDNNGVSGGNAAEGEMGSDSLALRCLMQAWRLDTF